MTKGLEGVVAVTSEISSIIDGVLTYRGINIDDLADNASFEEVLYLLWHGDLPNRTQLNQLRDQLNRYSDIPEEIVSQMKSYPKTANTMAVLRSVVSALSLYDEQADDISRDANMEKAIKLTAQLPVLITAYNHYRHGRERVKPNPDYSFAQNFLYMLNGEEPTDVAVQAFNKALVLHADHELNASTFSARVTTATLSDMYSAVTSAIGTLKGPLHGGANEQVMAMLEEIGTVDNAETYIKRKLDAKEKIMGFGHRVYKDGDPRARHLQQMSRQLAEQKGDTKWYDLSVKIEQIVEREKGLKPNVDFYSASVYTYLGLPRDLFTPIFAMSRISGWTAHILEQYDNNRLIRPRAEYTGHGNRPYVPLEER
ncbi:MAG: citrate synthase [Novibacillus thermophilus]|uniref:Citrate synthase n=1 Tax=Novibacillus thermophilus TaxID=1471761 RepID=A0A1U9K4Q6_9BACL|nr:citrate synthase [Novibacillus thermophilus]AQS55031.1 citrate synthase [Novibacillus thermophilus]